MSDFETDPAEAIARALGQLRGRRPGGGRGHGGRDHGGPSRRGGPGGGAADPHGHGDHPSHQAEAQSAGDNETTHFERTPPFRGPFAGGASPRGRGRFGAEQWAAGGRGGAMAWVRLVSALAASGEPLSISALGEAIGVDQPRASRLVQQAVEHGLARREADPEDARRTRIALTEEGQTMARRMTEAQRDSVDRALADFSAAEQKELARLLTKLAANWHP